ncbi:hypothetical protein J7E68_15180 [Microbacterium sp. ISL-103]|uniref:hypothetical protein n=1 Tax=Microbacterium sp. ISL-103 TaxID=2819156 RepID=UPI001BEA353A|nr:hypothetical protein [Microbacterium sp. ISL-103]MBT2475880.1 hypothetical protein [Microbacterium sp. ISL-103]
MDAATWLSLISALAAVAAAVAAWVARKDSLDSQAKREASELRAESDRRKHELEAGVLRRLSAESLATLAKAFVEAKDRENRDPPIADVSGAKRARMDFGEALLAWVDHFEQTYVRSTRFDAPEQFHRFTHRAHNEFPGNSAFWLVQWMLGLVLQRTMRIGGAMPTQDEISEASRQMRYLVRAWVEDPDLFEQQA